MITSPLFYGGDGSKIGGDSLHFRLLSTRLFRICMKQHSSDKKICFKDHIRLILPLSLTLLLSLNIAAHASGSTFQGNDEFIMGEVVMGRASWDTGWFQAAVFKQLMEELGYRVQGPKTWETDELFAFTAEGEIHLWANGWFPSHNHYLEQPEIGHKVVRIGYLVKQGALQGYLIDKKTANDHGITSLADFSNPEIAVLFDLDGNGKADLIGCNRRWSCAQVITEHLKKLELDNSIEQIQGAYSPLMAETVSRFKQGAPIFSYTWTPNWTVGELIPGKDVVWLSVPVNAVSQAAQAKDSPPFIKNVTGCVTDPCVMGWPANDIRIVANSEFILQHPAIKQLAESVEIPLRDISEQNARLIAGEDDENDIEEHARQWIHLNRSKVNRWLAAAQGMQEATGRLTEATTAEKTRLNPKIQSKKILRVAVKRFEPFVIYQNRHFTGFSIDLWRKIASEIGLSYELYAVNTLAKQLDDVKRGAADIAISGIGITSKNESALDFSHAYYESGLQIMVPENSNHFFDTILAHLFSVTFAFEAMGVIGFFLAILFAVSNIIWLLERRNNPQFPKTYLSGIWEAFWWAVVTVTTVGYGDKTPKGKAGRLFGVFWILVGYFVFAFFTARVSSTVTLNKLQGNITGPEHLFDKKIATVERSTAAEYLTKHGFKTMLFDNIENTYPALQSNKVDAIVFDAPVLQHYASHAGKESVKLVGLVFQEKSYGIALQHESPYREAINLALLKFIEDGTYHQIRSKWFG